MPDANAAKKAQEYLGHCMQNQDSSGGIIECIINGLPAGIGDPVFEKLDARLAQAILSIGAVKGFEIGDGFAAAAACGSKNNDGFTIAKDGTATKTSNHSGGTLGGMSDGAPLIFRAAVKPTPSISATQKTINKAGEEIELSIHGRHDPVVVPRAVVVVEAMAALTILDAMLLNITARMDSLQGSAKIRQLKGICGGWIEPHPPAHGAASVANATGTTPNPLPIKYVYKYKLADPPFLARLSSMHTSSHNLFQIHKSDLIHDSGSQRTCSLEILQVPLGNPRSLA